MPCVVLRPPCRRLPGLFLGLAIGAVAVCEPAPARAAEAVAIASAEPGWPQFRGPRRDGRSDERGLLQVWPEGGPKEVWAAPGVGRGFSAPIISGGRLYITGDFGDELHILAYDLAGKLLWRAPNGRTWTKEYPGARASVTLSASRIYHENAHGRVVCLEADTGKELWAVDLLQRFHGQNITWGLSECLLVDERAVYATAGGRDALLVALDKLTGEVIWRSEPLIDAERGDAVENAGYASPILVRFAGRRLLIGCSLRHLFCADADTGKIQWTRRRPTSYSVQAMMPVLVGDAVFMSAPFGPPGTLYRLVAPTQPDGRVGVEDSWTTRLDTCQGGAVQVDGRIFGAYYPARKGWAAVSAATGDILYETAEFAKGAVTYADNRLYVLSEDGWMLLLHPGDRQFEIKGRFRFTEARSRDAWAHPVIHDGRLYLRYDDSLRCYDIRAK